MEHLLITGGGSEYLPFARSCVKRLLSIGLEYANQSYEIDGVSIKVRIEPDNEYIRIDGSSVKMTMDSGMLGITGGIGEKSIWRNDPGYLMECEPALTYNSPFVKDAERPWLRKNASKDDNTQFSGDVSFGATVRGVIKIDPDMSDQPRMDGRIAAASLSPAWREIAGSEPPAQQLSELDAPLLLKKLYAIFCPASVFTGKCRLYMQAIYGLPLYEYKKEYTPGGIRGDVTENMPIVDILMGTSAAPLLKLKPYVAEDDFKLDANGEPTEELNEYKPVAIDTNCGVLLDSRGKHWLIQLNNGNIRVYPLISNKAGESLRKHLIPKENGSYRFNETAREHLEAYILSRCLPDAKNSVLLPTKYTMGGFSMGYGWHWNWSGDNKLTADIVVTGVIAPIDGLPLTGKMMSTHYRMVATIKPRPTPEGGWKKSDTIREDWSIAVSTVEKLKEWNVLRAFWCIAMPNFKTQSLDKMTLKQSALFDCDAPFYAYYNRNELTVCRVKVAKVKGAKGSREATPGYTVGTEPNNNDITGNTLGANPGFVRDLYDSPDYWAVRFYVGDYETPPLVYGRRHDGFYAATFGKSQGAQFTNPVFGPDLSVGYISPSVGYPNEQGEYAKAGPFYGTARRGYHFNWSWSNVSHTIWEEYTSHATVVVPLFDSECIYLWHENVHGKASNAYTEYRSSLPSSGQYSSNLATRAFIDLCDPNTGASLGQVAGPFDMYGWSTSGVAADAVATVKDPINEVSKTELARVVCKAGVLPCTWTTNQEFHANDLDEVGQQFYTRSGTSTATPTVVSEQLKVFKGLTMDITKDIPITTVGWV